MQQLTEATLLQKLAWGYAAMFVMVVAVGYIPFFNDAQGQLFGLFSLQLHDDILHLCSGIWAGMAAWRSERAALFYFRLFGVIYGLDGVVGLIFGRAYLDGGIFFYGPNSLDLFTRFATNLPHIMIGGGAVFIGFILSKKLESEKDAKKK